MCLLIESPEIDVDHHMYRVRTWPEISIVTLHALFVKLPMNAQTFFECKRIDLHFVSPSDIEAND